MTDTKFYYDFNFPLKVIQFLWRQIFGDPSTPSPTDSNEREWFSQPRPGTDATIEVLDTVFRLPLSVSEISTEILRAPCIVEFWYQDRANNWRQVMNMQRSPLRVVVSRSDTKSYYKFAAKCYPIVAKQFGIRLTRFNDTSLDGNAYVVGLRNTLIRRNVYDRTSARGAFEDEIDVFGNVISKYIKDWGPEKTIDNNPGTYWKSSAQPDPLAVVSLYQDIRGDADVPKSVSKIYIDPVYSGQMLNLYYSNDDTVGTIKPNPITLTPVTDENTNWRVNRGRWDTSTFGADQSHYRWNFPMGPATSLPAWIGIAWTPDFDPANGPPINPVLLSATDTTGPAYKPTIYYDVGAAEMVLEFSDGTNVITYAAPFHQLWEPDEQVNIGVGWEYGPDIVRIEVCSKNHGVLASFEQEVSDLPPLVTFGGPMEIANFRGLFSAHVIKHEKMATNFAAFCQSPIYYVDPDPVTPDANGVVPVTTLDNAILVASWTSGEHPFGGASDSSYENKEWTPIWRNYVTRKGLLHLPQAIAMKYLKLEFTNLSEEPYPIYESGQETRYRTFPVTVTQQSSIGPRLYTGSGGFLGLGNFLSVNGVSPRNVNWLDPGSVAMATNSVLGPQIDPIAVNYGNPIITETLPNQEGNPTGKISEAKRLEATSSFVYRRPTMTLGVLTETKYANVIKTEEIQGVLGYREMSWDEYASANPTASTHVTSTGSTAVRGSDWWLFPGGMLKLPARMMSKLTGTETVTERKLTLEYRVRFNTTSVHRYDWKTLKRDSAIAYFAGVREVVPYITSYIAGQDQERFTFGTYDADQWVFNNIKQIPEGPISTDAHVYRLANPGFNDGLLFWTSLAGVWEPDFATDGHYRPGTARVTATGVDALLRGTGVPVIEGETVTASVWVKWADVVATGNPVTLGGELRDAAGVVSGQIGFTTLGYADWTTHADSTWVKMIGTATVPAGAASMWLTLGVTDEATEGTFWFDTVTMVDATAPTATIYKSLTTASTFAKAAVSFRDSGLVRSDSMWADIAETAQAIGNEVLAPYVETIPFKPPGGMWGDMFKAWGSTDTMWGSPLAIIAITVDGDRRYQGKRVLRLSRQGPEAGVSGVGEFGVKVKQWTNMVPEGLIRLGCVLFRPYDTGNETWLRLRRLSDGVFIYETKFSVPKGQWFNYTTEFIEIPAGGDQEYEVLFTVAGDEEDEILVNDVYTEIAPIRYFMRLGGVGSYLHEVTELRYTLKGQVIVSATTPVTEMNIQAAIMGPEAWAFGCEVQPYYLK